MNSEDIQVFHVDDEPDVADLTKTFLEREDDRFAVETATSADEGLQRINDRLPDCVVSDYNQRAASSGYPPDDYEVRKPCNRS